MDVALPEYDPRWLILYPLAPVIFFAAAAWQSRNNGKYILFIAGMLVAIGLTIVWARAIFF